MNINTNRIAVGDVKPGRITSRSKTRNFKPLQSMMVDHGKRLLETQLSKFRQA